MTLRLYSASFLLLRISLRKQPHQTHSNWSITFGTLLMTDALNPWRAPRQDEADEAPRPRKVTLAAGLSRLQLADLNDKKLAAVSERDRTIVALTETNKVQGAAFRQQNQERVCECCILWVRAAQMLSAHQPVPAEWLSRLPTELQARSTSIRAGRVVCRVQSSFAAPHRVAARAGPHVWQEHPSWHMRRFWSRRCSGWSSW